MMKTKFNRRRKKTIISSTSKKGKKVVVACKEKNPLKQNMKGLDAS